MTSKSTQKPLTKAQLVSTLAEKQGLPKATVAAFLDALAETAQAQLTKKGPGSFTLPGIAKFKAVDKPATPEREGINPFTKQKVTIAAKPASRKVRVSAVKALKDALA